MTNDITKIPTDELLSDLRDSRHDINYCQFLIDLGIGHNYYNPDYYYDRRENNKRIVEVILAELRRRGVQVVG